MEAYKQRMIDEYNQLKERCMRIEIFLKAYKERQVPDFELSCPLELLQSQYHAMRSYLKILETRAKFERIDLIEKEKIYTVEIPVGDGFFQTLCQSGNGNLCLSDHKYLSLEKLRKHNSYVPGGLTEKKIKNSTVAWAWQFAKEVEDD
ncbi:hypothetical protein D8798_00905 [Streptococcus cristatus]|uniref:Phage protein n=1 Tax=Streptococcus cristatus TaxID=45634 RepID=A0A428GJN7_STRCR|nr:hypothetical protein [Streptococcus cristatus]RSJ77718.1 hypothetical protein D8798_00905 [Streptococcus cristatus]